MTTQLPELGQRADDLVTCQMRRGRGIPDIIPLSHAAKPKWQREDVVGPGGTLSLWKDARQARE